MGASVKIDKTSQQLPATSLSEGSSKASTARNNGNAAASTNTQQASTSVHLGATSAQLRNIESSIASAPTINAAKVAEIKQAISEGRFQVNSSVVADRLIASARELVSAGKR
jgi:negative regulator of flagellin synthesis FlgM